MQIAPVKSLGEILCPESRGVVSFVGGGGKTSLMFGLAHQLARSGRRVLTTTTTKIFVPTAEQSATLLVDADPELILKQAAAGSGGTAHLTAAAQQYDAGKLKGFAPEAIGRFEESGLFDWVLVEADGASRRPLKAPAAHEPVVPANTTVVVAVAGLEVLGTPLDEDLVFRTELAGALMGLAAGEAITPAALVRLFAHPNGAFKGAPPRARRFLILNKADHPERRQGGDRIAELLRRQPQPVAEALIVTQALDGVVVHAVHPLGPTL